MKFEIHLVESDPFLRGALSAIIRDAGYDVMSFSDGEQLLLHFLHEVRTISDCKQPIVLITENLPGMSGQEVICKACEIRSDIHSILFSPHTDEQLSNKLVVLKNNDVFDIQALGADFLLRKIKLITRKIQHDLTPEKPASAPLKGATRSAKPTRRRIMAS